MKLLHLIMSYESKRVFILRRLSFFANWTYVSCENFEAYPKELYIVMNTLIRKNLERIGFHITVHHEEKWIQELKQGRNLEAGNEAEAMEELNNDLLPMIC